jgi:hypothetical protein
MHEQPTHNTGAVRGSPRDDALAVLVATTDDVVVCGFAMIASPNRGDIPGEPNEVIEDWVVEEDGTVLCGAGLFDISDPRDIDGRVMRCTRSGEYETVGRVPSSVGRLELV